MFIILEESLIGFVSIACKYNYWVQVSHLLSEWDKRAYSGCGFGEVNPEVCESDNVIIILWRPNDW